MTRNSLVALAAVLSAASLANAQLGAVKPPAPKESKSSAPPKVEAATPVHKPAGEVTLGGSVVTNADAAATLIERDLEGKVKRLAVGPAEAAVKLLKLDARARAKVDAVLVDNAAAWDGFMKGNLKDVLRIAQGLQSVQAEGKQGTAEAMGAAPNSAPNTGPSSEAINVPRKDRQSVASSRGPSGAAKLLEELRVLMSATPAQPAEGSGGAGGGTDGGAAGVQSLRARGTLGAQLAAVLSAEEAMAMQALTKQYVDARVADRLAEAKAAGQELRPAQATNREMLEVLSGEFKRAYERTVGQAAKNLDTAMNTLQLSPEQESKFRQIAGDSFQKTYGNTSAQERSRVLIEIYQILSPEQREIFVKQLR